MSTLIVSAEASPLFGNFLMLVSVSNAADGKPVRKLKPASFKVHHLASLNHAGAFERKVTKAKEGPDGFYILSLKPNEAQAKLPSGHYVFAVTVQASRPARPGSQPAKDEGQALANGDIA